MLLERSDLLSIDKPAAETSEIYRLIPAVLIEPSALLRESLALALGARLGAPVMTYASVDSWLADREALSPCVVIVVSADIAFADAAIPRLLLQTRAPLIVASAILDPHYVTDCMRRGVRGYIPLDTSIEIFCEALKLVAVGGTFVPAELVLAPLGSGRSDILAMTCGRFTSRENAVLRELRKGKSNKLIAYELRMSESSVKLHVRNVMRKLQVSNRTEAVIKISDLSLRYESGLAS